MHIAQINLAQITTSKDDPVMSSFYKNIEQVNHTAKNSDGFIWLFDLDSNMIKSALFGGDSIVVNYSVWESVDALYDFTYKSAHAAIFKRKKEWFSKMNKMHMAIWYVKEGHIPDQLEASSKIKLIQEQGPSPLAFDFKNRFSIEEYKTFMAQ